MWFVKKSEILSLIDRECLDEVLPSFSDHRTVRKNEMIYRPDNTSDYVYLLKKGGVRLFRLTEDGQEITLSFIKEGMIFGDGDVLNQANYSHYAQTLAPSMICYIGKRDFKDLLRRYEVINAYILKNLYQRWQEAQYLIENLSLHDIRKRLVNLFVMFAHQIGREIVSGNDRTVLLDLPIPQDKLAEFIGTSRESVNRHMKELKAEGLIDMRERKIVLTSAFTAQYLLHRERAANFTPPAGQARTGLAA